MKTNSILLGLSLFASISACAVPSAYNGPLGNPEEPALRPYKWFFHGIKTLVHHPVARFAEGNGAYPIVGSLEVVRGAREGAVDFVESTGRGLVFSVPPQSKEYKRTGRANAFIDNDPMLSTVVDLPMAPLLVFDPHPAAIRQRMELVERHAREVREARRQASLARAGRLPQDLVVRNPAPVIGPIGTWKQPITGLYVRTD